MLHTRSAIPPQMYSCAHVAGSRAPEQFLGAYIAIAWATQLWEATGEQVTKERAIVDVGLDTRLR
jgi:hypothetical protein